MAYFKFDPEKSFEKAARKISDWADKVEDAMDFGNDDKQAIRIDLLENEEALWIYAEIPGAKKQDVRLNIDNQGKMTISGKINQPEAYNNKKMINAERKFGEFTRSLQLPNALETDKTQAKFENDTLEIKILKSNSITINNNVKNIDID